MARSYLPSLGSHGCLYCDALPNKLLCQEYYVKFGIFKELFFFLIFIDEISWGNRTVFWIFEAQMFYSSFNLSV